MTMRNGLDPYSRNRLGESDHFGVPHLLVGTPRVIAEFIEDPDYGPPLSLRHVILDEFDYLVSNSSFRRDIQNILKNRIPDEHDSCYSSKDNTLNGNESSRSISSDDSPPIQEEGEKFSDFSEEEPSSRPRSTKVIGATATLTEAAHNFARQHLTPGTYLI